LEPVFFRLTTISFLVPLAEALKARWSVLHMELDVEDWVLAESSLPLLERVEPVEPDEEEPEDEPWPPVEVPPVEVPPVEVPPVEVPPVEVPPVVELLAVVDALVLAEALDPSLLPHAVRERPAAAAMRARAGIFLTRIGTPGKRCRIGRSLRLGGLGCFIGGRCRAIR
jgi:hypothetical protein